MAHRTKQHNTHTGFTIIELLFVVAIISLLSSIILASLAQASSVARDIKRRTDLYAMATALELYYQDNGSYPLGNLLSPTTGTCISSPWWTCWGSAGETRLLPAQYIPKIPQDPNFLDDGAVCSPSAGNHDRSYMYYSDGQNYILATNLENPVPASDPHYYYVPDGRYGCTESGNWAIKNGLQ